jgi:hypothetical protein
MLLEAKLQNIDSKAILKKQQLRRFAQDKREAIKELAKLLAASFIKEL